MSITEQAKAGLIDDLNRNISILRTMAGIQDVQPADYRTLANCMLTLCVVMRGAITATGGDKFDLAALAELRKKGDGY